MHVSRRHWGVYMVKSGKSKVTRNIGPILNLKLGNHLENPGISHGVACAPMTSRVAMTAISPRVRAREVGSVCGRTFFFEFFPRRRTRAGAIRRVVKSACRGLRPRPAPSERTPCGHAPGRAVWSSSRRARHSPQSRMRAIFRRRSACRTTCRRSRLIERSAAIIQCLE